jgi:hypothetical protein
LFGKIFSQFREFQLPLIERLILNKPFWVLAEPVSLSVNWLAIKSKQDDLFSAPVKGKIDCLIAAVPTLVNNILIQGKAGFRSAFNPIYAGVKNALVARPHFTLKTFNNFGMIFVPPFQVARIERVSPWREPEIVVDGYYFN